MPRRRRRRLALLRQPKRRRALVDAAAGAPALAAAALAVVEHLLLQQRPQLLHLLRQPHEARELGAHGEPVHLVVLAVEMIRSERFTWRR